MDVECTFHSVTNARYVRYVHGWGLISIQSGRRAMPKAKSQRDKQQQTSRAESDVWFKRDLWLIVFLTLFLNLTGSPHLNNNCLPDYLFLDSMVHTAQHMRYTPYGLVGLHIWHNDLIAHRSLSNIQAYAVCFWVRKRKSIYQRSIWLAGGRLMIKWKLIFSIQTKIGSSFDLIANLYVNSNYIASRGHNNK